LPGGRTFPSKGNGKSVVGKCFTDPNAEMVKSYLGRLRYFNSAKTATPGNTRNLYMAKAKGGFIAFFNCLDIIVFQKIRKIFAWAI